LPGSDQILAGMIETGGETLQSEIHKLVNSVWNIEELPDQWKESITVPAHKKGDKNYSNNYRGISLPSPSNKTLPPWGLRPYIGEIIGDHQREFQRNRSITDEIFCIRQIPGKKWVYH
jgi:hypothetical protein